MTLVHVTLKDAIRDDCARKREVQRVLVELGMRDINQKRFDRFGILTGSVEDALVPKIRQMAEVLAVEQDREKHSL